MPLITARPNFYDSEFFVSEMGDWRLLDGASWEVRKEFRDFMRLTKEPFVSKTFDFRDWGV